MVHCHSSLSDAKKHLAALYVNDKKMRDRSVPMRRTSVLIPTESERRSIPAEAAALEIRSAEGEGSPQDRFNGYAAVFNTRAAIGNPFTVGFYEQIAPGAFTKTLQEGDARFLIDHNPYYVVARKSAGTLELRADGHGLGVDSALDPALSYVRDLAANVRNRNITGMSFGFSVVKDEWARESVRSADGKDQEAEVRTLLEVRLPEVSAVTFPAYSKTQAELTSVASALRSRIDLHGASDVVEAVEQRAQYWPELPELLGMPLPRRTVIDLGDMRRTDGGTAAVESHADTPNGGGEGGCGCGDKRDRLDTWLPKKLGQRLDRAADKDRFLATVRELGLSWEEIRELFEGPPDSEGEARVVSAAHSTPTSTAPWNADANVKNLPDDAGLVTLTKEFAWTDPKDPTRSAAKFPHHFVSSDGTVGAASTVACSAIIAALNGGRGGTDIPEADRDGVYRHAAKHLKDAKKDVPPMRSSEPSDDTRDDHNYDGDGVVEPAASTQPLAPPVDARMRAIAARYHLNRAS